MIYQQHFSLCSHFAMALCFLSLGPNQCTKSIIHQKADLVIWIPMIVLTQDHILITKQLLNKRRSYKCSIILWHPLAKISTCKVHDAQWAISFVVCSESGSTNSIWRSAVFVVDNTAHSCFLITIIIPIIIFLDNFPQLRSHSLLNCFFYGRCFPFQIILQAFLGTFSNSNINFLAQADVNCIFFKL